jgi:uncharacterized protein DUF1064
MTHWTVKNMQDKGPAQINGGAYQQIAGKLKPKANAKIKNAVKVKANGVSFDSRLEKYLYDALTNAGIGFEFQKTYTLQVGFKYNGETIRPIKAIVDFKLSDRNIIIDTKGWPTPISKLKYKMLKYCFASEAEQPLIYFPGTPKECDYLILKLLHDK